MRKFLTAALLAATILSSAAPALATAPDEYQQHLDLVSALEANGITFYLDADVCHGRPLAGFYHSPSKSLVICNNGSGEMTDENMDTLRHEAIHAIQDCKFGIQGDRKLGKVLRPGVVEQLARDFGVDLQRIKQIYESHGQHAIVELEYEAFSGAAGMSASTIAEALNVMCAS